MKASEITVGLEVAISDGTGQFDRSPKGISKVEVLTEPSNGYARVKFITVGERGFRRYRPGTGYAAPVPGDEKRVPTRTLWMPWSNYEIRLGNLEQQAEEKKAEEDRVAARLAEVQMRLDQFAGEVDEKIEWGGFRHREQEAYVKVPTAALLALLDRAEGK